MKIRNGFVSNSSSSSFLLCIGRIKDRKQFDFYIDRYKMKFGYDFYIIKASDINNGDISYNGFDIILENFATSVKISGINGNDELVILNISNDEGDEYFWDGYDMNYDIDLEYFKSNYEDQFEKYLIFSSRTNHAGIDITDYTYGAERNG